MDFGFLASANSITSKYLDQDIAGRTASRITPIDENTKEKFGKAFEEAYDSLMATRALGEGMRQSYEMSHQDVLKEHASRLGYSIDNRVIDMLHLELSDDMSLKVNSALNSAMESLGNAV